MGHRESLNRHPSTEPWPPSFLQKVPLGSKITSWTSNHLNFYRIHMLFFIAMPLIASGVFYASNGENHIAYIDALFMCVSASTVTGLNSVLLASLTTWQQVILFILMTFGSTTTVSLVTILIRRQFFRRKFEYMVQTSAEARHRVNEISAEEIASANNSRNPFHARPPPVVYPTTLNLLTSATAKKEAKKKKKPKRPRADMVRRMDVPVRVNQMNVGGWLRDGSGEGAGSVAGEGEGEGEGEVARPAFTGGPLTKEPEVTSSVDEEQPSVRSDPEPGFPVTPPLGDTESDRELGLTAGKGILIDDSSKPVRHPGESLDLGMSRDTDHRHSVDHPLGYLEVPNSPNLKHFPRARTVDFQDQSDALRMRRNRTIAEADLHHARHPGHANQRTLTRSGTIDHALHTGFGGFPNPVSAAAGYVRHRYGTTVERHLTLPRTTTLNSTHTIGHSTDKNAKSVSYITFDAVVGRNSEFHGLTERQQEELGGVEYRALTVLFRIVACYWVFCQLIAVLVLAPYLTYSKKFAPVFADPPLNPTWFVFFQVWSAWSNNGMSLVDASMVPFEKAYPLIVVMGLLILAGNTAFPCFLRLVIWITSKVVPSRSRTRETLQFLLDHPRRCFIYLFPAHQTWLLVAILVLLNCIDWVSFLVLDIGNTTIDSIPVGTRIIDGLLQAFAVRSAGFSLVSLSDVAPALQLLYVIMMYIAVYPIAVSIRSTNVYEEKSMGVFDDEENADDVEARFEKLKHHSPGSYIAYHARKQLAFDMWWLVLALWLICIIERHAITDDDSPWITIFTLLFEVCSSYGTVGLSLGTPTSNTSLSGTLRKLSKLVLCAVMIRGRHRGLPVAIDRSVLLPGDLDKHGDDTTTTLRDPELIPEPPGKLGPENNAGEAAGGLAAVEPQTDAERLASGADPQDGFELDAMESGPPTDSSASK